MQRKVGHTIHDILETIERVQLKTAGTSFAEFGTEALSRAHALHHHCADCEEALDRAPKEYDMRQHASGLHSPARTNQNLT